MSAENAADLARVRHFVELLAWAKSERDRIGDIEAEAKAVVQEALGDNETGLIDGTPVITWTRRKRTAVSVSILRSLHPEVAAECSEVTEIRTFRLVEP